jgi:hypothetical protein
MCIGHEVELPASFPSIATALGTADTLGGRLADAVPRLTPAMDQSRAMARRASQAPSALSLGEAQRLAGHLEEAYALAERTRTLTRAPQERGHEAYALRLQGALAAFLLTAGRVERRSYPLQSRLPGREDGGIISQPDHIERPPIGLTVSSNTPTMAPVIARPVVHGRGLPQGAETRHEIRPLYPRLMD